MEIILFILVLIVVIAITSAYFITKAAFKKLKNQNSEYAEVLSVLIFIFSLVIIGGGIFFLIAANVRLGR